MGLLFLALPALEIWGLFFFGAKIGFVNTLFFLLASAVLGFGLIRAQGAYLLANFQATLQRGQVPANQIFSSLMVFLAGVLLIVPGFFSTATAILLLLPGTRHLIAHFIRKKIEQKMRAGTFRMASFGNMGGFSAGFKGGFEGFDPRGPRSTSHGEHDGDVFRDVTPHQITGDEVIDVTPIKPSNKAD